MNYKETIESLRCCFGFGVCSDCKAKNMTEEDPLPCKLNCKERLRLHAADLIERLTAENAALREKVPQWISVEDRLPEAWKNEEDNTLINYMIYSPDFGVDIGSYHAQAKRWVCMGLPCSVTHWMPLPEAPEGGDKA